MIRPGDIAVLVLALALAAGLGLQVYADSHVHTARIAAGNVQHDYPLWRDDVVTIHGPLGATVIEIRDGRARIVDSPCTQKLCLRSGWIDAAGEALACVPNRVSVALLGDDPRFDAINF